MKVVSQADFCADRGLQLEAARILGQEAGLVCFPCAGTYRLCASLLSEEGVMRLLQTKRRSRHRPALVMVPDPGQVVRVAGEVPDVARQILTHPWPTPLTVKLPLCRDEVPRKVFKELSKPDGKVGVRLPRNAVAQSLVQALGQPLLVSSANRTKKAGADSVAMIKQQFAPAISMLIDAGDLPSHTSSTVVELDKQGQFNVVRNGLITEAQIREVLRG